MFSMNFLSSQLTGFLGLNSQPVQAPQGELFFEKSFVIRLPTIKSVAAPMSMIMYSCIII